jgi:histidine triad (HIT) family protein
VTVFQKIIDRELPADIVYEDDRALAFRDIHPVAPVHILVIPKKAIAKVGDATADDAPLLGHLLWVAGEVARREGLASGFRLVINHGADAGQTVFHLHVHLIAGRALAWPPG